MDSTNEKLSIQNMLFSKIIPNYVIPMPTVGHRVYSCTDCGDKFIMESSYEYHINRKTVKISYVCRYCNQLKIFYNRCKMLEHIRSHTFKTATINVSDLKIEPLPLKFINMNVLLQKPDKGEQEKQSTICNECKSQLSGTGTDSLPTGRVKHYMQFTKLQSCPLCMLTLPTLCALKSHLRFHLGRPPYCCPECGNNLGQKNTFYPYHHDCPGFRMMRATARQKCLVPECPLLHPSNYKEHLKNTHQKMVFKCPLCFVACFDQNVMDTHLSGHNTQSKALIFFQCQICPGKLVLQNQIDNHLKGHISSSAFVYPCWNCGAVFDEGPALIVHHANIHDQSNDGILIAMQSILNPRLIKQRIYRVVKRCEQCKESFAYKCAFDQIKNLPNVCPHKCTAEIREQVPLPQIHSSNEQLTCHMCQNKISQDWEEIKKHYNEHHKSYRCLDIKVVLPRFNVEKYINNQKEKNLKRVIKKTRSRGNNNRNKNSQITTVTPENNANRDLEADGSITKFDCKKCGCKCENKSVLETHLLAHRDPYMAYQCMECGECFVVKPSFSKHLLLEHSIGNVETYITEKNCFNENAFKKYQDNTVSNEPLRENQCKICREQFNDSGDLEKHFRVHGMAFLMKNNSSKNVSP